jgi:hypothetical protein
VLRGKRAEMLAIEIRAQLKAICLHYLLTLHEQFLDEAVTMSPIDKLLICDTLDNHLKVGLPEVLQTVPDHLG